ncbi:P-loop NTPase family protein, partial [Staphylococcus microti]
MKALKIVVNGLSNFKSKTLDVDFITSKKVNSYEANNNVKPLFNSIYKQNSMSFVGINASGKTTTLEIIESLLSIYIDNDSISFHGNLAKNFSDELKVTMYLLDEKKDNIYLINSTIMKENNDSTEPKLYFYDEDLYSRKVNKRVNRKNIFNVELYNHLQNRKALNNSYLKNEDSIFSAILNEREDKRGKVFELINLTDMNVFTYY